MAESYRSMRALERTASTTRVLNLAALAVRHAADPEHLARPLFLTPALNAAVIVKHRLRANEIGTVFTPRRTATKLIVPFERSDLSLGGRSLFVGDRGWTERLRELTGASQALDRDAGLLMALSELASLDPFLLRQNVRSWGLDVSETYFDVSHRDLAQMQRFVGGEIGRLIELAYRGRRMAEGNTARLVEALFFGHDDERLEPLRLTLRLEGDRYREGIFAWKGFLYYKWLLNGLWPKLRDVLVELTAVKAAGPSQPEQEAQVRALKVRLRNRLEQRMAVIAEYLAVYDGVFEELTRDGNAGAFRDFLLTSPATLAALGEGTGVVSHIATFWRFRFPKTRPLEAGAAELLDILQDFEAGLGGEAPALAAA